MCSEVQQNWTKCASVRCTQTDQVLYDACVQGCTNTLKGDCLMNSSCTVAGVQCILYEGCTTCAQCNQNQCGLLSGCKWTGMNCTYERDITPVCDNVEAEKMAIKQCNERRFCQWNSGSHGGCGMSCAEAVEDTCKLYPTACKWNTDKSVCEQAASTGGHGSVAHPTEAPTAPGTTPAPGATDAPAGAHTTDAPAVSACTHTDEHDCTAAGCKWDSHGGGCSASRGAAVLNGGTTDAHGTGTPPAVDCLALSTNKEKCVAEAASCMWFEISATQQACMDSCALSNLETACTHMEACSWESATSVCGVDCPRYAYQSWCEAFGECVWLGRRCVYGSPQAWYEVSPAYKDSPLGKLVASPDYETTPHYKDSPEYKDTPEYDQKIAFEQTGWDFDTGDTVKKFIILFVFIFVMMGSFAAFVIYRKRKEKPSVHASAQQDTSMQNMVDNTGGYTQTQL